MEKKVLQTIIQGCIDELVEDFMIFQNPVVKKSDDINNFTGYGRGERKTINFLFQCKKITKKQSDTFVKNYVNTLDI